MSKVSRAFRPGENRLESRIALSTTTALPEVQAEVVSLATTKGATAVSGSLTGKYVSSGQDNRAADAPLEIRLNGAGRVQGLGRSTMTGSLEFGGLRMPNLPDVTGTVKIRNAKGSLTVQLSGSGGNSALPGARFGLNASIVEGTGAYANLRGIGTANLQLGKNTLRCITTPCPIGGAMTLTLSLKPPVR